MYIGHAFKFQIYTKHPNRLAINRDEIFYPDEIFHFISFD